MERYSRQLVLDRIGSEGQQKLLEARVVVIGCGALGSVSADRLVRAGVGEVVVVDRDIVELSNLQRQLLFDDGDVGVPKAVAAVEKLRKINPEVTIEAVVDDVNFSNIEEIITGCDVVVDALDNTETRYLINDACIKNNIPWVYGGAISTYGMVSVIIPGETACLRCFMPNIPRAGSMPTCDTSGVLNTIPAIIASMQCTEAFKIILGKEIEAGLLFFDVWTHQFQKVGVKKVDECLCCGKAKYEFLDAQQEETVTTLCGRNAVQITPIRKGEISLDELVKNLEQVGEAKLARGGILKFKTGEYELSIFSSGRAIIVGTDDIKIAKSLYARYVGT